MRHAAPLLILALAGCAAFPELDARLTEADRTAAPPALLPLGPLLAAADGIAATPAPDLSARIRALDARAAALRGPVIDAGGADRIAAARALD